MLGNPFEQLEPYFFMSTNKHPKSGENRRQFLKKTGTAAAAVAALKVPVYGAGQAPSANVKGANEKITVGYIGVGGRGFGAHVRQMRQHAEENNIAQAAVCDVSTHRANNAKNFVSKNSKDKMMSGTPGTGRSWRSSGHCW